MYVGERKYFDDLVQDALEEVNGRVFSVEHDVVDAPPGGDFHPPTGIVAQLGRGRDGGLGVTGEIDLRHDFDAAPPGVAHEFSELLLGVKAAMWRAVPSLVVEVAPHRLST